VLDLDLEAASEGASFIIELSNAKNQKMLIGFDADKNQYFTDRTRAGNHNFSEDFPGVHYAPRNETGNKFTIKLLVDVASVELFADGGGDGYDGYIFP
jgi:sucrose-6-phosphate hydrolase SacC (GH32 family)